MRRMFRAPSLEHPLVLSRNLNIYITASPSNYGLFRQSRWHLATYVLHKHFPFIKASQHHRSVQKLQNTSTPPLHIHYTYTAEATSRSTTHRRAQRCALPNYRSIQSADTGHARSKPPAKKVAISPTARPSRTAKLGMQQSIHKRWLKRRLVPSAIRRTSMMGKR